MAWFQVPPINSSRARFADPEAMAWVSQAGDNVFRQAEEQLDVLREDLVRELDAARRIPVDMTADEFRTQIDMAWAGNPYLASFQHCWGLAPWGARFTNRFSPVDGLQELRVIRPCWGSVQFWVDAFQIVVDPAAGMAEVQINEDDFELPGARDLEKTISAFRVLHVELLRAANVITAEGCRSSRQLEDILLEIFIKAAGWGSLDPTSTVEQHFNEIRGWNLFQQPWPAV